MKTNKLFRNSAIVTAVLASFCCITPVLAVLGGLSGAASTFSFLEPLRPYLIIFTVVVLGFAFYNAYKSQKQNEINCDCEEENTKYKNFLNSKTFLWIVTVVVVVLITFPYYSKVFFPVVQNKVHANSNQITQAKIEIEGMSCPTCEQSINYALKSEKGVLGAESSYKTGIAYVKYDDTKVKPEQLKKAIEEKVGYKVASVKTVNGNKNK
ncbi:MAG: mercuric transport protein MerTP [Ignavibacteriales bacterium]|nr:mercuric transport protein MerTP [Ignavibacteriales bacterium]